MLFGLMRKCCKCGYIMWFWTRKCPRCWYMDLCRAKKEKPNIVIKRDRKEA